VGDLTTGEPFRWLGEDDDGPFEPIDALVVRLV
jgi:hypothetical protein